MNINPSAAAASIAGTSRAAARGGEADNQAIESTRQQSTSEKPGGKAADSNAIDAGDQTGDRDGNGRQILDQFEHQDAEQPADAEVIQDEDLDPTTGQNSIRTIGDAESDAPGQHLDLEA